MFASLLRQSRQRDVHVLTSGGERLTDDFDVPGLSVPADLLVEVAHLARNHGGLGRVGHQSDTLHFRLVPTAPGAQTRPVCLADAWVPAATSRRRSRKDR